MEDIVWVKSTDELPTVHDGKKGTLWKQHHKEKEFFLVLVHSVGEAYYFHESQLVRTK